MFKRVKRKKNAEVIAHLETLENSLMHNYIVPVQGSLSSDWWQAWKGKYLNAIDVAITQLGGCTKQRLFWKIEKFMEKHPHYTTIVIGAIAIVLTLINVILFSWRMIG